MPTLEYLRSEIERMRTQIGRQRKEILQLQRAGIGTASAEALLTRMQAKVEQLVAQQNVKSRRVETPAALAIGNCETVVSSYASCSRQWFDQGHNPTHQDDLSSSPWLASRVPGRILALGLHLMAWRLARYTLSKHGRRGPYKGDDRNCNNHRFHFRFLLR